MNNNDSEFTNLTRAQVGALQECFDFLRNGYEPFFDTTIEGFWHIFLKHKRNGSYITVKIYTDRYIIRKRGNWIKQDVLPDDGHLYRLSVDSDLNVTVTKMSRGVNKELVSG